MINKNTSRTRRLRNQPISVEELQGVYTALITPMHPGNGLDNAIDYAMLYHLIDDQARAGVNGIVAAGTTGQSPTLSPREHIDFVANVFQYTRQNHPRLQFIAGAGSNCTREALEMSQEIEKRIGHSTFLHVTGYYNNPPQEGIIAHYERLAESLPRSNIIMYNVPSRTGSRIEPETAVYLAENFRNIIGIKEASGNAASAGNIITNTDRSRFRVLSGEDNLVAQIIEVGGTGVISASANAAPRYFVGMTNAALGGDYATSNRLQQEINPLVKDGVFYRKNPIPLAHMFNTQLRLPLIRLPGIEEHLQEVVSRYDPIALGVDLRNYRNQNPG